MKTRKQRFRKRSYNKVNLKAMLAQPSAQFYKLPEFELRGGYLVTEGCRKVLDFEPEKICLDMGDFLVTFYGAELRIESLTGKRLIMAGSITDISFRNKWEGPKNEP